VVAARRWATTWPGSTCRCRHRTATHYPFEFYQADALQYLRVLAYDSWPYDAIHASPPCQPYSVLRRANPGAEYPDLVAPTRELLETTGLPWVMENERREAMGIDWMSSKELNQAIPPAYTEWIGAQLVGMVGQRRTGVEEDRVLHSATQSRILPGNATNRTEPA
jgi:hypothetical protein